MTILQRVKIKLGITDDTQDEVLTLYIEDAENDFMAYTGWKYVPAAAQYIIEGMVAGKHNSAGNEGLASQSYSGVSESYLTDYPEETKSQLNKFRKVRFL